MIFLSMKRSKFHLRLFVRSVNIFVGFWIGMNIIYIKESVMRQVNILFQFIEKVRLFLFIIKNIGSLTLLMLCNMDEILIFHDHFLNNMKSSDVSCLIWLLRIPIVLIVNIPIRLPTIKIVTCCLPAVLPKNVCMEVGARTIVIF